MVREKLMTGSYGLKSKLKRFCKQGDLPCSKEILTMLQSTDCGEKNCSRKNYVRILRKELYSLQLEWGVLTSIIRVESFFQQADMIM